MSKKITYQEHGNTKTEYIDQYGDRVKPTLQPTQWVEMYHDIASYVEEMSALDPIFDDNGMRTKEAEENWIDIVDNVENIMSRHLKKLEVSNND
tara:strand:+ start:220 stop:501 length:282 start_codon:yes stop_codon:yes gene_type:complete